MRLRLKILPMIFLYLATACSLVPVDRLKRRPDEKTPQESSLLDPSARELALLEKAQNCKPADASVKIPMLGDLTNDTKGDESTVSFSEIRSAINSACKSCHLAPGANLGGFSYSDSLDPKEYVIDGSAQNVDGFKDAAKKMAESLIKEQMPPESVRQTNPEFYIELGNKIQQWIDEGQNTETIVASGSESAEDLPYLGLMSPEAMTEIGDCIPQGKDVGYDLVRDLYFSNTDSLPDDLSLTDLFTMDNYDLAKNGTVSYAVEYPLWSDHSAKWRAVHVPARVNRVGKLTAQSIKYDGRTPDFEIPENTRFYKTFFRAVKGKDGEVRHRRIETRIIVVRYAPREPLFGTYIWSEDQSSATLAKMPYRDGSMWKDQSLDVVVNDETQATRAYVVPARHRCVECHMGASRSSFILGFTPLQINRRNLKEGGRDTPIKEDEKSQAERLVDYGLIKGVNDDAPLPELERFPSHRQQTDYALRAQGYVLGNCAHCHNPAGFAFTRNAKLDLSAGQLFTFNTNQRSAFFSNRSFVDHGGTIERSYLYFRAAANAEEQGLLSPMPLHTAGRPDCRALKTIGQWILTFNDNLRRSDIEAFKPQKCSKEPDFEGQPLAWVEEDFTINPDDPTSYVPRRTDWQNVQTGMPQVYRDFRPSVELMELSRNEIAVDFWSTPAAPNTCNFPTVDLPTAEQKPWMLNADGTPKSPFGQLYKVTPGAWLFTTTCSKCHGERGTGDGDIGRSLMAWSGGQVRVADFIGGMFGKGGENLRTFDAIDGSGATVNLAGQYMMWMAMEGTRINVPPQAERFLGRHKAQMLKQVKDRCSRQIPSSSQASSDRYKDHEIFRALCFFNNSTPDDPLLQFDPQTDLPLNVVAQEAWLDKAALHAGWTIFDYLKERASRDLWQPRQDECQKVFGATP